MKQEVDKITDQPSLFGRDAGREALDHLFSQVSAYRNSREYFEMMQFIGRLPIYAPFNMFLLYTQNPRISYVATASQWHRRFGRKVRKGARPLVILAPMSPVLFVYDMADTDGPPVPDDILRPFRTGGKIHPKFLRRTLENCRANGIRFEQLPLGLAQAGYCRPLTVRDKRPDEIPPARFEIVSKSGFCEEELYATLVHELGHILAGHLGPDEKLKIAKRPAVTRRMEEMEAESISYLVCTRQSIETTSAQYLAGWAERNVDLPDFSLDMVLRVAGKIEDWAKAKPQRGE